MRTRITCMVTVALLALTSCEKERGPEPGPMDAPPAVTGPSDYRDAVTGEYLGIDTCSGGTWGGPGGDPIYTQRTFTVWKDTVNTVQVFIDGWAYVLQEDLTFSYVSGSVVNNHGVFTLQGGGTVQLYYSRAQYETGIWASCHFTGTKN